MRHLLPSILVGAGVLAIAASAHASVIGVTVISGSPDVTSLGGTISYNSTTDVFTASGIPVSITPPASGPLSGTTSFTLTLNGVTQSAANQPVTITSGTLSLTEDSGATTLFSSSVTPQFGFTNDSNTPTFYIVFPSGSGTLDSGGGPIGVVLGAGASITNYMTNQFTASFGTGSTATADTSTSPTVVPEPASLSLAALGGAALLLRRRRRR